MQKLYCELEKPKDNIHKFFCLCGNALNYLGQIAFDFSLSNISNIFLWLYKLMYLDFRE